MFSQKKHVPFPLTIPYSETVTWADLLMCMERKVANKYSPVIYSENRRSLEIFGRKGTELLYIRVFVMPVYTRISLGKSQTT
jgi:hypothetical protein